MENLPLHLKKFAIRPSLKKPSLDSDNLKNYMPLSNLTYLSKILEKAVHGQLTEFTTSNNLFTKLSLDISSFTVVKPQLRKFIMIFC